MLHCTIYDVADLPPWEEPTRKQTMTTIAPRADIPLQGVIRLLRHSELPQFKAHLLRLDVESRRDRFNGLANDAFVSAYAEKCFRNGAVVIGYVENGKVLGAAELHEQVTQAEPTGEIAFSVEPHMQQRGLGGLLFSRLIESARAFGYERLRVTTHPQNGTMKRLAMRFNATLRFEDGETVGMIGLAPMPPLPLRPGAGAFVPLEAGAF